MYGPVAPEVAVITPVGPETITWRSASAEVTPEEPAEETSHRSVRPAGGPIDDATPDPNTATRMDPAGACSEGAAMSVVPTAAICVPKAATWSVCAAPR